jgi:hypothetical protein
MGGFGGMLRLPGQRMVQTAGLFALGERQETKPSGSASQRLRFQRPRDVMKRQKRAHLQLCITNADLQVSVSNGVVITSGATNIFFRNCAICSKVKNPKEI